LLVCPCNRVSDHAICDSIRDGAGSIDEAGRRSGVGTRYGCHRLFQAIVEPFALSLAS